MRNRRFVSIVVFCLLLAVLGASAQAAKDQAVTYQINTHHTGAITTPGLVPPLKVQWSVELIPLLDKRLSRNAPSCPFSPLAAKRSQQIMTRSKGEIENLQTLASGPKSLEVLRQ
jgi:hypothetical protein